jgi:cell division protein FtsW
MLTARHAVSLCALSLLLMGVVMVQSAGMGLGRGGGEPLTLASIVASRPALYALVALACLGLAQTRPVRTIARRLLERPWTARSWWMLIALVAVCLLPYAPGIGRTFNGAQRWIMIPVPGFGDLSVQPSELAKWGIVLMLARYGASLGDRARSFSQGLLPGLLAAALVAVIVAKEDLGTAVLIAAVAGVMLLGAGVPIWRLAALAPAGLAGVAIGILVEPYRIQRLTSFLNPFADPQDAGFHMIQSMSAIAGGGVFGRGLGFGIQKFGYLPEVQNDFLFAVICEELGFAGASLTLALELGLIASVAIAARSIRFPAGKLVALGVATTLGVQACINVMAVTGLGPTKGIALPLLSAGGTGWALTACMLGLVAGLTLVTDDEAEPVAAASDETDAGVEQPPVIVTRPLQPASPAIAAP